MHLQKDLFLIGGAGRGEGGVVFKEHPEHPAPKKCLSQHLLHPPIQCCKLVFCWKILNEDERSECSETYSIKMKARDNKCCLSFFSSFFNEHCSTKSERCEQTLRWLLMHENMVTLADIQSDENKPNHGHMTHTPCACTWQAVHHHDRQHALHKSNIATWIVGLFILFFSRWGRRNIFKHKQKNWPDPLPQTFTESQTQWRASSSTTCVV